MKLIVIIVKDSGYEIEDKDEAQKSDEINNETNESDDNTNDTNENDKEPPMVTAKSIPKIDEIPKRASIACKILILCKSVKCNRT